MKISSPFKSPGASRKPKPFAARKSPLRTRPQQQPVQLPKIILTQLQGLSARVLQIAWTEGFLRLGVALCAIALVQGTVDWLFDLPRGTRFLFALGDLGLLGWLVFRHIVQPWRRQLTQEQAALRAEKRWPFLRTALVSAVQLSKNPEGSRRMVEMLVQQVTKRAAQMDFRTAVNFRHLKKLMRGAAALLLVTGGLGWWLMPKSQILLERILLFNVPLPTQTIVVAVSRDLAIGAGETIEITAKAQGVVPRTGSVEITYDGKDTQKVPVSPKASSPDTFTLVLPNVQQGLIYRFHLNDGRGDEFKVVILHGPVLEKVSFGQIFPAYTGLAKTPLSAGNLTLLAGSKLHVEGRASQELKSARAQLKGVNREIPLVIGSDGKSMSGDIPIPAQALEGFSIIMQNTDGIESQNNTLYRVEVVPDKPPEITFDPGQPEDKTFVETDRPGLRFKVVDDFQVKRVFLCCVKTDEAAAGSDAGMNADAPATTPDVKRIPIDVPTPAGSLNFDYVWKAAADSGLWKEGGSVTYWIEAEDNNDVTGPGIGKSGKRQWRVITVKEKEKELTDKLGEEAGRIDAASEKQMELQKGVGDTIRQGSQK